jgi:hypothetical protein
MNPGEITMRRILEIAVFLFVIDNAVSQPAVTFQLNLDDIINAGLFSPDSGDKVYIRGSFNDWNGVSHQLKYTPSTSLYQGCFDISASPGDTVAYKYVIRKDQGRIFWESNPDPGNPDHGNRRLVITGDEIVLPEARFHYDEYFGFPVLFNKDKLRDDFLQFRAILEETHPALYDYTEKNVIDSLFESNYARIDTALDFRTFLILMTEVISKVGCGHSSMWVPGTYWNVAPQKFFPLKLHISDDEVYTTGTYGDDQGIPIGAEILTINGIPVTTLFNRLESLTSADGFNPSFRRAQVSQKFSVKYALAFGFPDTFQVVYISPGSQNQIESALGPVSKELVDQGTPALSELSFEEVEGSNSAVLTINTFSYYTQVDMFRDFIDSVFHVINRKSIGNLILDLRGNGGGDPFCASYLWAYLQPEPLPYFEEHYGKYDTLANPVPLPSNHFLGNLYTLIDGNGFSTTGHFCGLLKYHRIGKFVGTELGATYTCTGNATYPTLKHTGIMVGTARVGRYTAAVKNMDPRRGIMPDFGVELTQQDIITGNDPVLEFALSRSGDF